MVEKQSFLWQYYREDEGNVQMIGAITASASLMFSSPLSRATGPTAEFVARMSDQSRQHLEASVYFGLAASGVFDELHDICDQCGESNWDGYGAVPVTEETYRLAYRFLESLPWGTPAPSVGAEPDGHLTFEWHSSPRRTLSVSVSPDGDLHYAALVGVSKKFGSEPFFGEAPKSILELIGQVCGV